MPPTEKRNLGSYNDSTIKEAIETIISECFTAMCFANAFGGMRSDKWDMIHSYKVDEIFAEAKRRNLPLANLKMAVGGKPIQETWAKKYLDQPHL